MLYMIQAAGSFLDDVTTLTDQLTDQGLLSERKG